MAVYDPRGGGNTHIDVVLTQISVAWPNNGYVGESLYPRVDVRRESDKYYIFGREGWALEPGGDFRAPGSVANEIPGLQISLDTYFAKEHSLQIAITDEERENVDSPLQPDVDGTELVTSKIMLQREILMQTQVTTAANFATGYSVTLAGTQQWNDYVNSTPISDVRTGFRKIHSGL